MHFRHSQMKPRLFLKRGFRTILSSPIEIDLVQLSSFSTRWKHYPYLLVEMSLFFSSESKEGSGAKSRCNEKKNYNHHSFRNRYSSFFFGGHCGADIYILLEWSPNWQSRSRATFAVASTTCQTVIVFLLIEKHILRVGKFSLHCNKGSRQAGNDNQGNQSKICDKVNQGKGPTLSLVTKRAIPVCQ